MTGDAIHIRPARESDLTAVLGIERDSFGDPWSRESFETSLSVQHFQFLVAEQGGADRPGGGNGDAAILGYLVALLLLDEAEIADIAVAPAGRRRGVGGRLLDRAVADIAQGGAQSLYLEVRESNSAARALYESRGFLLIGRRRAYYRDPAEDALVMKRDLGQT